MYTATKEEEEEGEDGKTTQRIFHAQYFCNLLYSYRVDNRPHFEHHKF